MHDPFDPNTIRCLAEDDICRIYAEEKHGELYALVDRIDYQWALQWIWSPKLSRGGSKMYLRRNLQITHSTGGNGQRHRTQVTLFLHTAIIELRMGLKPPTPHHVVDHRNSNALDCRRRNLRWATKSLNRLNRDGAYAEYRELT